MQRFVRFSFPGSLFVASAFHPGLVLAIGSASSAPAPASQPPAVVRMIQDPQGGPAWLLLRDGAHPGGPGLMVRADQPPAREAIAAGEFAKGIEGTLPVIRAGDRLLVEGHSAHADVGLEGVALEPARTGEILRVRIKTNSGIVKALAVAPGRVRLINLLTGESKERP